MRQYPRRVYKGDDSKLVTTETDEMNAASEGWECARNAEKIAIKEKAGGGILRGIETPKIERNVPDPEPTDLANSALKELSPQKRAAITRKKNKEAKED